jgi:hypothetical protein
MLWPLCPRDRSPHYPLNKRAGGSQNGAGRVKKKRKFSTLPGLELQPLIVEPVAIHYTN